MLNRQINLGNQHMKEEKIKCKGIDRFKDSQTPKTIHEELEETQQRLFKSLKRYQSTDPY